MIIPPELFKNDTVYKYCGGNSSNGIIACGFLKKEGDEYTEFGINFRHYGAFLILSGTGKYIDEYRNETFLYPGCYVQRLPGKVHSTIVDKGSNWLEFFICIGAELYESFNNISLMSSENVLYPGVNPYILNKFISLLNHFKNSNGVNMSSLLLKTLNTIFCIYENDKDKQFDNWERDIINRAYDVLMENALTRHTIAESIEHLGVDYEYFRKLFKKYTGLSPKQYQVNYRINYAQQLMIEGNYSIKNVALETGYTDVYAFSKQFKKIVGISPTEFIANYKSSHGHQQKRERALRL